MIENPQFGSFNVNNQALLKASNKQPNIKIEFICFVDSANFI